MRKVPDTLVIVLVILFLFAGLTWIIPSGEYARKEMNGRMVVVPGSYQESESAEQGIGAFLMAPIKGFVSASQIIGFIFLVGGAFSIINRTGAINSGLERIINFSVNNPKYRTWIIPFLMVIFSLCGATFGMSEEVLVFILISIPLARSLGYDSITGVAIPFIGAGAGFAGAITNPFTIGIAQGIAELPPFSGIEYRIVVWAVLTLVAIIFVMIYANNVYHTPTFSPVYELDMMREKEDHLKEGHTDLTPVRKLILGLLFFSIIFLVYGVQAYDWYINEIAALFIALGIVSAILAKLSLEDAVSAFKEGAKDMITAALVVGLSKGVLIIATEGKIIDTILFHVANAAEGFHPAVSVQVMFLVQSFINFFVPSGSGQAALTMPIMSPLSDLLGITRQTAVLAFQFGDGLSNMIIPTSGVTMGVLAIAKIPYDKWFKWMLPLFILLTLTAMVLLIPPVVFFFWGPH